MSGDLDLDVCTCEECFEEHTCPFAVEINDDSETLCTCCASCEYECAMAV